MGLKTSTDKAFRDVVHLLGAVAWTLIAICAGFAACAGWFLIVSHAPVLSEEGGRPAARLSIKSTVFTALALLGLWRVLWTGWRVRKRRVLEVGLYDGAFAEEKDIPAAQRWIWLGAALIVAGLMVFPRLYAYPRAEPDEIHHLIVARNLAAYGLYATGHPAVGFEKFDDYDSVGPPVILPIAGVFKAVGPMLGGARLIMALYYIALCAALFALLRPILGTRSATVGIVLMTFAFGSVYLARSLYGEVPALFYIVLALLAWRAALDGQRPWTYGLVSGLAFGMALLCKSILIIGLWALVGVWLLDRLAARRIRWVHLVPEAIGAVAVLAVWFTIQELGRGQTAGTAMGIAAMYQHNLLFGFSSLPRTGGWLMRQPATLLVMALSFVLGIRASWGKRNDPPTQVLLLLAPFLAFWWVFFTTGNIPRYMWYSCAILAAFSGYPVVVALRTVTDRSVHATRSTVVVLTLVLIAAPALWRLSEQGVRVYARDEMTDDRAVAHALRGLPPNANIATTVWPLEGAMNFLAGRYTKRLHTLDESTVSYTAVVTYTAEATTLPPSFSSYRRIDAGRYAVLIAP